MNKFDGQGALVPSNNKDISLPAIRKINESQFLDEGRRKQQAFKKGLSPSRNLQDYEDAFINSPIVIGNGNVVGNGSDRHQSPMDMSPKLPRQHQEMPSRQLNNKSMLRPATKSFDPFDFEGDVKIVPCRWSNSGWKYVEGEPASHKFFSSPNRVNTFGISAATKGITPQQMDYNTYKPEIRRGNKSVMRDDRYRLLGAIDEDT